MKKFKDVAENVILVDKIPQYLNMMEENPKSKEKLKMVFESKKFDSEFMTGRGFYKPISKFGRGK